MPIRIGGTRPQTRSEETGVDLSVFENTGFGLIYKMWKEEVNGRDGIPAGSGRLIELHIEDNHSELRLMTTLLEKRMRRNNWWPWGRRRHLFLSPATTPFIHAAAPIFNKHGYVLMGAEGGSMGLREMLPGTPYCFNVLNFSDHNQMPVMAEIFEELQVTTAAIVFVEDSFGMEYAGVAMRELRNKGIEVKMVRSVPTGPTDFSSILQETRPVEGQPPIVDAFLAFVYPHHNFPIPGLNNHTVTGQAMQLEINFKVLLLGPGGSYDTYKNACENEFGPGTIEGVMALGAWNRGTSPGAEEFYQTFSTYYPGASIDWWGDLYYWAGLQCLEQAIERAGSLNQEAIRVQLAKGSSDPFNTALGDTWFERISGGGGLLAKECHPGQIGQWRDGVFEVVDPLVNEQDLDDPLNKRTKAPIDKPPWPTT